MTTMIHRYAAVAMMIVLPGLSLPATTAHAVPVGFTAQVQSLSSTAGTYPTFAWRTGGLAMADFDGDGRAGTAASAGRAVRQA